MRDSELATDRGDDDDLVDRYARACWLRAEALADEAIDIADGKVPATGVLPDGSEAELEAVDDHVRVQRDKLRVDARKWFSAKLSGRYAERHPDPQARKVTCFADLAVLAAEAERAEAEGRE